MTRPSFDPDSHADWTVTPEALERTFRLEDPQGPHDLASAIVFIAQQVGVSPSYAVRDTTLTLRLESDNEAHRARFLKKVNVLIERRRVMREDRNLRPARAFIRLWDEAQTRFEETVDRLRPEDLDRPTHPAAQETIFEEAVRHPAATGYSYLQWTRRVLGLRDTNPPYEPKQIMELESVKEVRKALGALRADVEATLEQIPEGVMNERTYLSYWGWPYFVDQMLEHAVMHLHRHRLQIEGYLEQRDKQPGS